MTSPTSSAATFLHQEAIALLTRLDRVRPFVVHETMVVAAAPTPAALSAVERFLIDGRAALRRQVNEFLDWLAGPGAHATASEQQRRFVVIRLAFNDVLSQFDLFTEALTQRSEHETGVWLSGLDILAADALRLSTIELDAPPVICYLARGPGAAIRRARTRLPGGGPSPAALIRIPRERMISQGIGSSLVHEVGHQAAALLGLVESMRAWFEQCRARSAPAAQAVLTAWHGWLSEVVADIWSVAKLGIGSTLGLIGVVSLPRRFVFRPSGADPHPVPWLRVRLSCALGDAFYPDPQWRALDALWTQLYPPSLIPEPLRETYAALSRSIPEVVDLLLRHKPASFGGQDMATALRLPSRTRTALLARHASWQREPSGYLDAAPTLTFAVIGQARASQAISPRRESEVIGDLLTGWAVRSSLDTSVLCATRSPAAAPPLPRTGALAGPPR